MKAINSSIPAKDLKKDDLWIRPLPEDEAAVVQVVKAEIQEDGSLWVTYDSNFLWAGDATYTEAMSPYEQVRILILADTPEERPLHFTSPGARKLQEYAEANPDQQI